MKPEDLEDQGRFRLLMKISYSELAAFVLDYVRRKSTLTLTYWSFCLVTLGLALTLRINVAGHFEHRSIMLHTLLGSLIFPVLVIPVHELLHIIPYYLTGARNIRIGMDLKQFIFYVTAHRYVVRRSQFRLVAWTPFVLLSAALLVLVLWLPGLWKWSLSLFLFVHTTMCAGDFAMLNYFHLNRHRKIHTWDDADLMEAYFYEEI
jgi:hypothetical protein